MQNLFNSIRVKTPAFSTFDLSNEKKISGKMGKLIPVWTKEMLPGDRFSGTAQALLRMATMVTPPMHRFEVFFHAFFVPYRLLWPNWELFITGGQMGDIPPAIPFIYGDVNEPVTDPIKPSSLDNYLTNLETESTGITMPRITAFRHAAYQRIWFDWYRDQNLQDNYTAIQLQDGDNHEILGGRRPELRTLRTRAWEHDYFTSALPFAQKGDPVGLPIDFSQLQVLARQPGATPENPFNPVWRNSATGFAYPGVAPGGPSFDFQAANNVGSSVMVVTGAGAGPQTPTYYDPLGSLYITGLGASSINDLRSAQALQRWLEKNARGGTRYTEALRVHFGVTSSDARMQRAEYLGGSKGVMAISEVLQTSETSPDSPQGNMAGHGISVSGGNLFSYRAEEHGQIMVIMSIRPRSAYYQGIPRELLKQDRLDFYFQEFAALGEQPVYNSELCYTGTARDTETFGYLPRFAEYRVEHNSVVGQMATTLEFWHAGRKFDTNLPPDLNEQFILCDPTKRYFTVEDPEEDEIFGHLIFKIFARRPLPAYGTPL